MIIESIYNTGNISSSFKDTCWLVDRSTGCVRVLAHLLALELCKHKLV